LWRWSARQSRSSSAVRVASPARAQGNARGDDLRTFLHESLIASRRADQEDVLIILRGFMDTTHPPMPNFLQKLLLISALLGVLFVLVRAFIPMMLRNQSAGLSNDIRAAAACKAFAEAQEIYRRTDYDGDGVLEYSPTIKGNFSLVEKKAGAGDLGLLDRTFGVAEGSPGKATPKAGYVFKVLTAQGPSAKGGAKDYFKADKDGVQHMTEGYALVAAPGVYDGTGHNCYIINNDGIIFQADLGPNTAEIFDNMTTFNPDSTWTRVE
jgi:hypothetical protein